MVVFKVGDRVAVVRSFGAYVAGERGTVVSQLRPYIHVSLDNPRTTKKASSTLFQSDEIIKVAS